MKKAKMIIGAIALFAIVGGALAFKSTVKQTLFYSADSGNICTVPVFPTYTTTAFDGFVTSLSTSPNPTGDCSTILVTTVAE